MKRIIFILTFSLLFQCVKKTPAPVSKIDIIEIDIDISTESIDIANLVDSSYHIKLETNNKCLLQRIKKLVITEEELIVLDDFIYIFDLKGNFKSKIGSKGRGPGELLGSNDFVFDIKNKNIEVYDFTQDKICVYTNKGEFITEFYNYPQC